MKKKEENDLGAQSATAVASAGQAVHAPREVRGFHDCGRVDELMSQFGLADMDELKHTLEDAERWAGEIVRLSVERDQYLERLREIITARERYDAECVRVFGGCVNHAGRAGPELMALIRAADIKLTDGNQAATQSSGDNRGSAAPKESS